MNVAATIGFLSTIESVAVAIAAIFTIGAAYGSLFAFWSKRTKRKKLIEAVYHHVSLTRKNLKELEAAIADSPNRMRADEKYTPYAVISREDNLAYSDLIELMLSLNSEEGKTILNYFHAQASLHAIAASLGTEVFRGLLLEQKIGAINRLEELRKETLKFAVAAEEFLKKKRKNKA